MNTSFLLNVSHDTKEKLLGLRHFDLMIDQYMLEGTHQFDFIKEQLRLNGFSFKSITYARFGMAKIRFSIPDQYFTRSLKQLGNKVIPLQEMLLSLLSHLEINDKYYYLVFVFFTGKVCQSSCLRLKFGKAKYPSFYFESFDITIKALTTYEMINSSVIFNHALPLNHFLTQDFTCDDLGNATITFDIIDEFKPKTMNELVSMADQLSSRIYNSFSRFEDLYHLFPNSEHPFIFNLQ